MTGPTGLINFFVLEASDYVEQLDGLLRDAGPAGPEAESFTRAARALRGSATMAKRHGIAALAAAVERLGRALRERVLPWTPAMRDALAASVEELRQLVRAARNYGADDEQRAQARTAELLAFAPPSMRAAAPTPIASGSGTMFVVSGASDVAAALTASASRPANHELHAEALNRLRGFRGVAALRDHLPLAETLDIVERVARNIDRQDGLPGASAIAVLSTGARHIRRLAEDIRSGRAHDRQNPEAVAFADAVARHEKVPTASPEVVVPIASLFFSDDGPRVVRQTAAPVTTAADRFRLESAAAGEHLRKLAGEARREVGSDAIHAGAGQVAGRASALQTAADSLADLARSYGYDELGDSLSRALADIDPADALALAAGDAVGALLVAQRRRVDDLARRIGDLAAGRVLGSLVAVGYAPLGETGATPVATAAQQIESTPASTSTQAASATSEAVDHEPETSAAEHRPASTRDQRAAARTTSVDESMALPPGTERPTGRDLHALLASSIAGFERMQTPAEGAAANPAGAQSAHATADAVAGSTDAELGEQGNEQLVSVEVLLYRGRSALGRALELRDEIRRQGGTPPAAQLDELFDLLDLAVTA